LQPLNNQKPIVNDSGSPTSNNIFEPNETASLLASLENTGGEIASSISAVLSTSDATININNPIAIYPDIPAGNYQNCSSCYSLTPQAIRPSTHWDFTVSENILASSCGPYSFDYIYHVGYSFIDVNPSDSFYKCIEALLHNNIVTGCTTNSYCPFNYVSREQLAKFICLSMNLQNPNSCAVSTCNGIFSDVPISNPFCRYIEAVYNANVIGGCHSNPLVYCPSRFVKRQAIAKFVCLAMDKSLPNSCVISSCNAIFKDVPPSNPFCPYIEATYNAGIVNECQTDPLMYCPYDNITREEMAKVLFNAFNPQL